MEQAEGRGLAGAGIEGGGGGGEAEVGDCLTGVNLVCNMTTAGLELGWSL